jgi:hypothetical protein
VQPLGVARTCQVRHRYARLSRSSTASGRVLLPFAAWTSVGERALTMLHR